MFRIILFYIKENIKSYIVAIVLLSILFVLCGLSYESFLTNQTQMSYTDSLEDSLWIYPREVLQKEQEQQGKTGCAYLSIPKVEDEESYACIFLEELLANSFLMNLEGRNFSYTSGRNEVILYGDTLNKRYAIGENIQINGVSYQVVGKLPSYMPLWNMFLFFDLTNIELDDVYEHAKNGDMLLINNKNIFKQESAVSSCVFSSQKMSQWDDGISMKEAKKKLFEKIKERQLFEGTSIVLLFCLAGYFCLILSVIQHKKSRKLFGILILSGMGRVKYYFFLIINSFSVIDGAVLVYFSYMLFYVALFAKADYHDERFWPGQQCILGSLCGLMFCILLGFHLWEYRTSVSQLLKEG